MSTCQKPKPLDTIDFIKTVCVKKQNFVFVFELINMYNKYIQLITAFIYGKSMNKIDF